MEYYKAVECREMKCVIMSNWMTCYKAWWEDWIKLVLWIDLNILKSFANLGTFCLRAKQFHHNDGANSSLCP